MTQLDLGRLWEDFNSSPGLPENGADLMWTISEKTAGNFKGDPTKSDQIKFDDKFPGFGLRIRRTDGREHRTYIFQYKFGPKHHRMNCGTVGKVTAAEAREAAQRHAAALINNKDPAQERTDIRLAAAQTVGARVADYLAAKGPAMKPASLDASQRHLLVHWKPLHELSMSSVTRANVAAGANAIAKTRGPVAANRARATLSAFFAWAIGEGDDLLTNPVAGTNQQEENGPRERSLSDTEVAAVWLAAPDNDYGRIVKLLMLTGCRREEIGSLQWSEINFDARTITLPADRTKNAQAHVVPLTDAALSILQEIPHRDRAYVFGRTEARFSGWSKSKRELDAIIELKEPWTLHDLRRTVRTGLGMLGVAPHIAEAVLNHLPAKLIRTYDRNTYAAEKRDALERWANHLAVAIAQASGANVVKLKS
jgi:integrase